MLYCVRKATWKNDLDDTWQQAHQDDARGRHMGMDSAQEIPKMTLGPFATHAVQVARQCKGHTPCVHAPRLHSTRVKNGIYFMQNLDGHRPFTVGI